MKIKNIRISSWRQYKNESDTEELADVRRMGGKAAVRAMKKYIPPQNAYEKWIYVNESARLLKKREKAIRFLIVLYQGDGKAENREFCGKYGNAEVRSCISLQDTFHMDGIEREDYVIFLDAGRQQPAADALSELAGVLQETHADMIYSDEDEWEEITGQRINPFFKPDWSPDTFASFFYTGNLAAYRMEFVRKIAPACWEWISRGEDFDACHYRFAREFVKMAEKIVHIPEVLCHVSGTYRYTEPAGLTEDTGKTESAGINSDGGMISIIIPSKDHAEILKRCLESLERYDGACLREGAEIIVVDNGSCQEERLRVQKLSEKYGFRYLYHPMEFNFSAMCNRGAGAAKGRYLLFLNDDIEALETGWLSEMKRLAERTHVGAVGAKLYYPGGKKLQHLGVVNLSIGPGHCFLEKEDEGNLYFGRNRFDYNYLAVTAACLMVRREVFEEVGGFDEALHVAYNDVDLCFSVYEKGYYNVLCNRAVLCHHESLSRGSDETGEKKQRLLAEADYLYEKHPNLKQRDPFYSPNLTQILGNFEWNLDAYGSREDHLEDLHPSKVRSFRWDIRQEWLDPGLVLQIDEAETRGEKVCIAGWAYLKEKDNFSCIRRILLRDEQGICLWIDTRSRYRGYLREQFPTVKGMEMLAFSCVFRSDDLPGKDGGRYQIGMAAESRDGREMHIVFTEKYLEV